MSPTPQPFEPAGPGAPFELLFAEHTDGQVSLPKSWQRIYGSDWRLPSATDRPHVFVNLATSRDGRISFSVPGHAGGGDVTDFNPHDRWLMGLLRARADAVMIGDNTLRLEEDWRGSAECIFPPDERAFIELRQSEGRNEEALHVVLSLTGDLPAGAAIWNRPGLPVLVATTTHGRQKAHELLSLSPADITVLELGQDGVDVDRLMRVLHDDFGARIVLCEGGARVYGSLLRAGRIDEEFLTLCPIVMGSSLDGPHRPSLVEGVAFAPGTTPRTRLISLRRAGDYLFLHSRYA